MGRLVSTVQASPPVLSWKKKERKHVGKSMGNMEPRRQRKKGKENRFPTDIAQKCA